MKRKHQTEKNNNYEYWKDPRLDDEGTYDYLVEELPRDSIKWEWYNYKCQSCGKDHRLNLFSSHYFYCWDGWDSMDYTECWRCVLKGKVYSLKRKTIRKVTCKMQIYKDYHGCIKKLKDNNVKITPELKRRILKIYLDARKQP